MKLHLLASCALLCVSAMASAADQLYTYTGNPFTVNNIGAEPSRMVAHFVLDFDTPAANGYTIKQWDVSASGLSFSSTGSNRWLIGNFTFGNDKNITDWHFQGLSSNSAGFLSATASSDPTSPFMEFVLPYVLFGPSAGHPVHPGTWTVSTLPVPTLPVPEPETYLMLAAGLAVVATARQRKRQRQST